jgi:hypothetical protein
VFSLLLLGIRLYPCVVRLYLLKYKCDFGEPRKWQALKNSMLASDFALK